MKHTNYPKRFCVLNRMPRNMLKLHGYDNISELVLHDLACRDCFNLCKAAYFVDNPAFNCLKGVAGYSQDEAYTATDSIWDDYTAFSKHMEASPFNQKVRQCVQFSCKGCDDPTDVVMRAIAHDLGMEQYAYCCWDLKHDNHGYLIYEANDLGAIEQDELINSCGLLGFCPIF